MPLPHAQARKPSGFPIVDGVFMERLGALCRGRGLGALAERLQSLAALSGADLVAVETELATLPRGRGLVERSAAHLLDLGGKRLRPMCVALAARCGAGFDATARALAVAVELVHSATLLHDDVVDLGDRRRGAPTARTVYGNAASIFAGDWLLVEALERVRGTGLDDLLARLLSVIAEMIAAESTQLGNRGRLVADRAAYLSVVEGKTAALFRWAMFAGGRAGGLAAPACGALEAYGRHLGVAFQAIDDLLDFTGGAHTGKTLFADLREGKMTYPLILAVEREPALAGLLAALPEADDVPVAEVTAALERTGAVEDCRAFARERAQAAIDALGPLPDSDARQALITVAAAAVEREK